MVPSIRVVILLCAVLGALLAACGPGQGSSAGSLTIYSGRVESLVGPVLDRFAKESGINVRIRYGDSAELAAALLEEGANSPADVFFAQDAGALGLLSARNMFSTLPDSTLNKVDVKWRSPRGEWVGVNARARVVAYNSQVVREQDLPDSALALVDPRWRGRVGWAPTNASFQAFVTAVRLTEGEQATRQWLLDMKANNARAYPNNIALVKAVAAREIDLGLTNHYYKFAIEKDEGATPVQNYHPRDGKAGAMINVAGAGILKTSKNQEAARRFVEHLLSTPTQEYFVRETHEYPLISGIPAPSGATPISQIRVPNLDLSNLTDLDATLRLLRETGAL